MTFLSRSSTSALAAVALFFLPSCVSDKPADQPPTFSGSASPQESASSPPPPPAAAAPAPSAPTEPQAKAFQSPPPSTAPAPAPQNPLPGLPVDPTLLAQIGAAGLAVLTPGGVAGDPIEAGIKAAATRHAPNMQPEGQMAKDTLPEGGHKSMLVTLAGGKCYTIIGFSPAGQIRNLDLRLLAPPFYNVQSGQDDTSDGTPIIGKGSTPSCPITPFPLQYKLDIHAQKGGGPFGVQVFSRSK